MATNNLRPRLEKTSNFLIRTPKSTYNNFQEYVAAYADVYSEVKRENVMAVCFDEWYKQPVSLEDYKGEWICTAYSDAWFQAFGYDAKASYTTTEQQDIANSIAKNKQLDSIAAHLTVGQKLHADLMHDPTLELDLPRLERLHFQVVNEQKLYVFGFPVQARASAETLNKANTRLKVDFGFGAPRHGNYLIIGYKAHKYAVVGDFDRKYLWFLTKHIEPEETIDKMKEHAILFGYTPDFLEHMNYRKMDGHYYKPAVVNAWMNDPIVKTHRNVPGMTYAEGYVPPGAPAT